MKKPRPLKNILRPVKGPKGSILGSGRWEELDWDNWWMDAWDTEAWRYLHVQTLDGERVYRVYPREKKGRRVTLHVKNGELFWSYDATKEECEAWMKAWKEYEASQR